MENTLKKIGLLVLIIGILSVSSLFIALVLSFVGNSPLQSGNVAVIPITGVITYDSSPWSASADPDQINGWLKDANENPDIKLIVLDINSPGGSAVASDEIAQTVKATNKTVVAWIRGSGASGAYWIASESNHIIANRMSITGSVGVTASYIDWGGTLNHFNATYEQFKGGEFKEVGTPYQAPTPEERALFQGKIDKVHDIFVAEVKANRNLTDAEVDKIKTGEFFLGVEAIDLHLVDQLGGKAELDAYVKTAIGAEPQYTYYAKPQSLLQELGSLKQSFVPNLIEPSQLQLRT